MQFYFAFGIDLTRIANLRLPRQHQGFCPCASAYRYVVTAPDSAFAQSRSLHILSLSGNEVSSPDDLAEMDYPAKGVVTASGQEPLTIYKSRDNAEGRNTREAVKFSFDKVNSGYLCSSF